MSHNHDTQPMRRRFWTGVGLCIALAVTLVSVFATISDGEARSAPKLSNTVIGNWHQTSNGIDGVIMQATISSGSIQIHMKMRDATSIYWMGTFDTDKNTTDTFKVKSLADSDAMKNSVFGSQDKTKMFEYENGDLTFRFTMMNMTTTVHMDKT